MKTKKEVKPELVTQPGQIRMSPVNKGVMLASSLKSVAAVATQAPPSTGGIARFPRASLDAGPATPPQRAGVDQLQTDTLGVDTLQELANATHAAALSPDAIARYKAVVVNQTTKAGISVLSGYGADRYTVEQIKESVPPMLSAPGDKVLTDAKHSATVIPESVELMKGVWFNVGVYITIAHTGGGKTGTMLALVDQFNSTTKTAAAYVPVDEPRMPKFWRDHWAKLASNAGAKAAPDFIGGLKEVIAAKVANNAPRVLVVDSVVLRMKMFGQGEKQATFEKGYQVSDRQFFTALSNLAYEQKLVLFATMNSEGITYVEQLRQGVEGLVTIEELGKFTMQDRGSIHVNRAARTDSELISLHPKSVIAALRALNVG